MLEYNLSVALCTYNGENYIREQIDSIFNQSVIPNEIIICDDNSTDNSIKIIESYIDNQQIIIKLFKNKSTIGIKKNFEKALSLCSGEFIFLSDQDDIWEYNKVEKIITYFEKNTNKTVVFTNAFILDNKTKSQKTIWEKIDFSGSKKLKLQNPLPLLRFLLLKHNLATGATMALRSSVLHLHLPFNPSDHYLHDYLLALQAAASGTLGFIDESLIFYRTHADQQIGLKKQISLYRKLLYKILDVGKNTFNLGKIRNEKIAIAKHLQKFTNNKFPEALPFLRAITY